MASGSSTSPAVGRALDILGYLADHASPVPASVLARDLDLPRSSVYHIVNVCVGKGFVTYLPDAKGYILGPQAFELASAQARHEPLERVSRPVMKPIAADLGIAVHLGILRGANTVYLLKERPDGGDEPELVTDIGVLLPAHLTANGRAILAQLDDGQLKALFSRPGDFVRRTPRGPRSLSELRAELKTVRQQGWAEEIELVAAGLRSIGVAIFDGHGHPLAALSATWRSRIMTRNPAPIRTALTTGATEITRRLQGRR